MVVSETHQPFERSALEAQDTAARAPGSAPIGPHAALQAVWLREWLPMVSRTAGAISILVGVAVLAGWVFGMPLLTTIATEWASWASMEPNTALAFVLAGASLVLSVAGTSAGAARRVGQAAGLAAAAIGLLTLLQYAFHWNLGIDLLLVSDAKTAPEAFPGRMSPTTALSFVLVGAALMLINVETPKAHRLAQYAALVAGAASLLAFIGHTYGVHSLYVVLGYSSIAIHTAGCFTVLSLGILFARPQAGLMALVTSNTAGSHTVRRLIPIPIILMPALGWLTLQSELAGYFDTRFGTSLMVTTAILVLVSMTWWHAMQLHRTDLQRRRTADRLHRLTDELERRVADRTTALEAANKELEAFSYSVAHDLRAPLRAMDGFSRLLVEEHGETLPSGARRYAGIVRQTATQMAQMVDDLLAFSRLGRQPVHREAVETARLVQQVLADLRPQEEGRRVNITVGELPACNADPSLLKQVFANLLDNALKFTRRRQEARVDVGATRDPAAGETVYFVKDNGAGFDMQYAHKLFGVFQRLHRSDEYEGTGVGLASVQRIIHRHGGRVWVEAEPDRERHSISRSEETRGDRPNRRDPVGRRQPQRRRVNAPRAEDAQHLEPRERRARRGGGLGFHLPPGSLRAIPRGGSQSHPPRPQTTKG